MRLGSAAGRADASRMKKGKDRIGASVQMGPIGPMGRIGLIGPIRPIGPISPIGPILPHWQIGTYAMLLTFTLAAAVLFFAFALWVFGRLEGSIAEEL